MNGPGMMITPEVFDLEQLKARVAETADGERVLTLMHLPDDPDTAERYFLKMGKICNRYKLACVKVSSGTELLIFNPLVYSYQDAVSESLGHLRFVC